MCINQHTFEYFWGQYQSGTVPRGGSVNSKKSPKVGATNTHTHTHTHNEWGHTHYKWGHNVPTRSHTRMCVCVCVCVCVDCNRLNKPGGKRSELSWYGAETR